MDFQLKELTPRPLHSFHAKDLFHEIEIPIEHSLTKRKISSEIDLALGFNIKKIEEKLRTQALQINPDTLFNDWGPMLHNGAQTWVGLDFQILQCSYHDIKTIVDTIKIKPHQTIVDLGAGYGRIGIYLHFFHPQSHFLGIELVEERVHEANRIYQSLGMDEQKKMIVGDLSQLSELPEGEIFFIYDFGSQEHLLKIINLLKATKGKILIVKGEICHRLMMKDSEWGEGFKIKRLDDVFLYYT